MIYVTRDEFSCPCCGRNETSQIFADRLNECRNSAGVPFRINSGYRCEDHNREVGGSINSAHTYGQAADIEVDTSQERFLIIQSLINAGFTRIGVYRAWIHVDQAEDRADMVMWYV